jgi:hypothetical protein
VKGVEVPGVDPLAVTAARADEGHLRVPFGRVEHIGIEVGEGGREDHSGPTQDHQLIDRGGDVRAGAHLGHPNPFHLLQRRRASRVGLVVAAVVFRPGVEESDDQLLLMALGGGLLREVVGARGSLLLAARAEHEARQQRHQYQRYGDASPLVHDQ